MNQELNKINNLRGKALRAYIPADEISLEDEEIAWGEIDSHEDKPDGLMLYVFDIVYTKGKSIPSTIRELVKKKRLSPLSASLLTNKVIHDVSGSMNLSFEISQLNNLISDSLEKLIDYRNQCEEQGTECETDVSALYAELRQWFQLKSNLISTTAKQSLDLQNHMLVKEKADNPLAKMSTAELLEMMNKLKE